MIVKYKNKYFWISPVRLALIVAVVAVGLWAVL